MKKAINSVDIVEVYSPPRVVKMAESMGLSGGWSLDIFSNDVDGRPWDFSK